jgi:hypothetical protein
MARWGRETAGDTDTAASDNDNRDGLGLRKNNNRPTMEAVGIGGRAQEDVADNEGFGGQRRQGEGKEEAREACRIDKASKLEERENRCILADDDDVPPPPDPTSPWGEGCQGGVHQRHTIRRPSRSGDGSAHNNVPSPPTPSLEHGGAQSGPKINKADAGNSETAGDR